MQRTNRQDNWNIQKTLADAHAIYITTYHNKRTSGTDRRHQNNNDTKEKDGEEGDDDTGADEDLLGVHAESQESTDDAIAEEEQTPNEAAEKTANEQDVSERVAGLLGLHDSDDDYEENTEISLVSYTSSDELVGAHITIPTTAMFESHHVRTDIVEHHNTNENTSDDDKLYTGVSTALTSAEEKDTNIGVKFSNKEKRFLLSNKSLHSLLPTDFQQGGW